MNTFRKTVFASLAAASIGVAGCSAEGVPEDHLDWTACRAGSAARTERDHTPRSLSRT